MRLPRWLPALLWGALITVLLAIPGGRLPDLSWFSLDKIGHLGLFLIWAWLWAWAWEPMSKARYGVTIALAALWASGTEALQAVYVPGREAEWADVLADLVGFGLGLWSYHRFECLRALLGKLFVAGRV
ncbi:MAG: VanZ family protein [Bacteroidetes bacterium]|nr:VanZ family protein [Rhodothermia bacterium]MCS7155332.1 VanZ family protein [Bacteroidota bacterium]MCX7907575.1 VanZ family protein [Bacteroidota bacterium]MDW8138569.1 VanZ family protein [Bacteroidota bacterium]MDW8284494.1 VanZ family protein [Bacteroidota bacterium]